MKQTRIVLTSAMLTLLCGLNASASTTDTLTPYTVSNPTMLQTLQPNPVSPLTAHSSGRRLKTFKGNTANNALQAATSVNTSANTALARLSDLRKARQQTTVSSTGIAAPQQRALARLAAAMPDQSANFRAYFDQHNNTPTFVKFNARSPALSMRGDKDQVLKASSRSFLHEYRDLLKIEDTAQELILTRQQADNFGNQHFLYQQSVNGVPVWGSEVMLHLRDDNSPYLLNGRFHPSIKIDTTAELTEAEAEEKVRESLGVTWTKDISSKLVVYPGEDNDPRLAYEVDVYTDLANHWLYFIDAHNGAVLHRIDYRQKTVVTASGTDEFGSTVNFNAWQDGSNYFMIDTESPTPGNASDPVAQLSDKGDTYILDARNGAGEQLYLSASTAATSGWDPTAVTAMKNTISVYDYYKNTFNRNSIDDAEKSLITVIHFESNYNNAFWNGNLMVFGDGDGQVFNSLARCLDVTAHELTHGVVSATAGLKYENQSGALNEAYADIMAAMVDRNDWTLGEDCTVATPGYLRNMQNPSLGLDPQPTKMSEYRNLPNTEQGDNGGVHVNNSIPSHAAYLMAEGLTNEGTGTSIGRAKTEQIFYRALTTYLTASAQFIDARNATLQAAEDLYGANSAETTAVARAWDLVEVTDTGTTPPQNTPTDTDPVSGDDLMIYIYPDQNTGINTLYAQIMTDPLVYNPVNDISLQNTVSANAYVRPAAYTSNTESEVFYVGEDANLYVIDISPIGQSSPSFSTYQLSSSAEFWSIALAPDGQYFAYTSNNTNDNHIYVWDLDSQTQYSYLITPPDYSDGSQTSTATVLYADALAFDYTGRYITFDAENCISTQTSSCASGGGYRYWSIGIMNVIDGSVFYPIPSQSPDLDIGFPSFAQNNNYLIAVDVIDYSQDVNNPSSRVMALDFESQQATLLHDFGSDSVAHLGVPSFWGDDLSVTLLAPGSSDTFAIRKRLNSNGDGRWEAANATTDTINAYAAYMPVMHRAGQRSNTGNITPSSSQLNFGSVNIGAQAASTLMLSNTGNSDINITNIQLNGNDFTHNGTNFLLPRSSSVIWTLAFAPSTAGARTGSLTITTDGAISTVNIALTGTAIDPSSGGSGGNSGGSSNNTSDSSGGGFTGIGILITGLLILLMRRSRGIQRYVD